VACPRTLRLVETAASCQKWKSCRFPLPLG
jgi:hypothetical protein